jgi:hypothetical protein
VAACEPASKKATDEFVVQYINSIVEQTEFYKKYSRAQDIEVIELVRPRMTNKFKISRWDYISPGNSEYVVSFSNGAKGVVAVYYRDGVVEGATLMVGQLPNEVSK